VGRGEGEAEPMRSSRSVGVNQTSENVMRSFLQNHLSGLRHTAALTHLAMGSAAPSAAAGVVVAVGGSGPPGGVGSSARRLGRTCAREPGTGSGSSGARFPRMGLRSRSLARVAVEPAFLPACCSASTFQVTTVSQDVFTETTFVKGIFCGGGEKLRMNL